MKKSILFILIFLLILPIISAEVSNKDKNQIQNQILLIANSLEEGDIDTILDMVSPNATEGLRKELELELSGQMIDFQESINKYEDLGNNQVRVTGSFSAKGPGWSISGLSNFFVFEKSGDSWLLVDTNFHKKLGPEAVIDLMKDIFNFIFPIIIILVIIFAVVIGIVIYVLVKKDKKRESKDKKQH